MGKVEIPLVFHYHYLPSSEKGNPIPIYVDTYRIILFSRLFLTRNMGKTESYFRAVLLFFLLLYNFYSPLFLNIQSIVTIAQLWLIILTDNCSRNLLTNKTTDSKTAEIHFGWLFKWMSLLMVVWLWLVRSRPWWFYTQLKGGSNGILPRLFSQSQTAPFISGDKQ